MNTPIIKDAFHYKHPVIADLMVTFVGFYIIVSVFLGLNGLLSKALNEKNQYCDSKWVRIEYIQPSFRLGCWLGERTQ